MVDLVVGMGEEIVWPRVVSAEVGEKAFFALSRRLEDILGDVIVWKVSWDVVCLGSKLCAAQGGFLRWE